MGLTFGPFSLQDTVSEMGWGMFLIWARGMFLTTVENPMKLKELWGITSVPVKSQKEMSGCHVVIAVFRWMKLITEMGGMIANACVLLLC
jgi:hypothetical protein